MLAVQGGQGTHGGPLGDQGVPVLDLQPQPSGQVHRGPRRALQQADHRLYVVLVQAIHAALNAPEGPPQQVLLERLRRRRREDDATIQHRFAKARDEIARARACGAYDEFLTNDELDQAVREATRLVRQELGRRRQAQRP